MQACQDDRDEDDGDVANEPKQPVRHGERKFASPVSRNEIVEPVSGGLLRIDAASFGFRRGGFVGETENLRCGFPLLKSFAPYEHVLDIAMAFKPSAQLFGSEGALLPNLIMNVPFNRHCPSANE
jgi:hypothetical protein